MSKYFATYKCQMCGAVIKYGESADLEPQKIHQLVDRVVKMNQYFAENQSPQQAQMYLPHRCKDGSGGLALFVGFKREN